MRIFRSDDGAEIREEDVLKIRLRLWDSETHEAACRIDAALGPKTCGSEMTWNDGGQTFVVGRCVLPPGHHPFERDDQMYGICDKFTCRLPFDDPIHSPGHQTAAECWRES